VYFGSALKLEGVESFLDALRKYSVEPAYDAQFGAKVFKISRDDQGNRLTHLKVTGGSLKVKDLMTGAVEDEVWEEKINQIRLYSGEKFEPAAEVFAGTICTVTGLTKTHPGQGLGVEQFSEKPYLEPVLNYQMILPDGINVNEVIGKLRQLEEEEPELHIVWDETLRELHVHWTVHISYTVNQVDNILSHNRIGQVLVVAHILNNALDLNHRLTICSLTLNIPTEFTLLVGLDAVPHICRMERWYSPPMVHPRGIVRERMVQIATHLALSLGRKVLLGNICYGTVAKCRPRHCSLCRE
jgi:hypothetical protein